MENLEKVSKLRKAKFQDSVIITIKCNRSAADEIIPLLKEFKRMGNRGNSRGVTIEDYEGKNKFGFDGDGPSKIKSIINTKGTNGKS